MNEPHTPCPTCRIVDTLCFWGDMPQKRWKRPVMLAISIASLGGLWFLQNKHLLDRVFAQIVAVLVALVLLLGIVVSLIGCDRCVAKLFGKAET